VLGESLRGIRFAAVLSSPLLRAQETCRIAGLGGQMELEENLREWNYGEAEGKTTAEMREVYGPAWSVWTNVLKGGETVDAVGERADRVIARALAAAGDEGKVALFAHAHILRILAARWIELAAVDGKNFALGTGSLSVLGFERENRVVERWNREFERE
jgi:broad specificity phosphatase PhoE